MFDKIKINKLFETPVVDGFIFGYVMIVTGFIQCIISFWTQTPWLYLSGGITGSCGIVVSISECFRM